MSITATQIIDQASLLIGARAAGETLNPSELYDDGLIILNTLVNAWQTSPQTMTSVTRQVFALTADRSTYTIGSGGDFNTTRPMGLTGAALLLNPTITSVAVTGVSTTNGTFTVAGDQTTVFTSGTCFTATGANAGAYTVVSSSFSVSTTITVGQVVSSSTANGTLTAFTQGNSTVEIPTPVITDDQYQLTQIKSLSNSLFTTVYFNPSYARNLATITLWPVPNVATNALVLYRLDPFSEFSTLSATYDIPPGYKKALVYNFAVEFAPACGKNMQQLPPTVLTLAASSLADIKRQNTKWNDTPNEAAWAINGNPRGRYNINTSNG